MSRRNGDFITNNFFPETIKVHEHKAPTDESIKILEDFHDKAIKNIIAKIKVENNLVKGECICHDQPWNLDDVKLWFKFNINGEDFLVTKELSRRDLHSVNRNDGLSDLLMGKAKDIMLWYVLKQFTQIAFTQITGTDFPEQWK